MTIGDFSGRDTIHASLADGVKSQNLVVGQFDAVAPSLPRQMAA
jgi:hypothetical protein